DHLEDRVVHLHGRKHSPYSTSNHLGELVLVRRHPSRMSSAPASAERRFLLRRGWFADTSVAASAFPSRGVGDPAARLAVRAWACSAQAARFAAALRSRSMMRPQPTAKG